MPEMLHPKQLCGALLLMIISHTGRAQADSASLVPYIRAAADSMTAAFSRQDFKAFVNYSNPRLVEMLGGRESFINFMERQVSALKGMRFNIVRAGRILRVIPGSQPMQCIVEQWLELDYQGSPVAGVSHLIGISDDGKSWTFADGNSDAGNNIKLLIPGISPLLVIPKKKQVFGVKLDSLLKDYRTVY